MRKTFLTRMAATLGLLFALIGTTSNHAEAAVEEEQAALCQKFGEDYAKALRDGDIDWLVAKINFLAIARKSGSSQGISGPELRAYEQGFIQSKERFAQQLINNVEVGGGDIKFTRAHFRESRCYPVIRMFSLYSGFEYYELSTTETRGKGLVIDDIFVLSNGENLTDTIGAMTALISRPSESILQRVLGRNEIDRELLETVKQIGTFSRDADFPGIYRAVSEMPDYARHAKVFQKLRVKAAALMSEETHRDSLEELSRLHGKDPDVAVLLIDHYIYKEDYEKSLESLKRVTDRVGRDAVSLYLVASIEALQGNYAQSIKVTEEGIAMEPDLEILYWIQLTGQLALDNHQKTADLLKTLESSFGYQFSASDFVGPREYAKFILSDEYGRWMAEGG